VLSAVQLVGAAREKVDARSKALDFKTDIVSLAINLFGGSGIEITKEIREKSISSIVVFSNWVQDI